MSAHTPGPWMVNQAGSGKNGFFVIDELYVTVDGADVAIAADIADPLTGEKSEANARLIAAAPDLLAAAQAALKYDRAIAACGNDPDAMSSHCTAEGDDLDALYDDWMSKSRAAIAKATGSE